MGRKRTWTDDDLRAAVAHAKTYTEVVELLRSRTGACSYMSVRVRIADSVSTPSTSNVLPALGGLLAASEPHGWVVLERPSSGSGEDRRLKRRIAELGLDTGHFEGRQWSKGQPGRTPAGARLLEEILVRDPTYSSTSTLRKRLFRVGLLENLRAICPNGDAFTDTHCGRNIGRYDEDEGVS